MGHNTRVRADLAAWSAAGVSVTPGEFYALDSNAFKSINGDDGGTWAPLAAIEIGGAGVVMTGDLDIHNDVNVKSGGALIVESGGSWTLLSGATGSVSGALIVASGGTATAAAGSTVELDGQVIHGSTAVVKRYRHTLSDADATITPRGGQIVLFGSQTANRTLTLDATGVLAGEEFIVVGRSPTYYIDVVNGANTYRVQAGASGINHSVGFFALNDGGPFVPVGYYTP